MRNPKNSRASSYLSTIPQASLDSDTCMLAKRCKFNFNYFDNSQDAGQDFSDWSAANICELLNKLKNYSEKSLRDWEQTPIGNRRQNVLEIYGGMPARTDFKWPKHVPHQARWARFRLEGDMRLIGFVIPEGYHLKEQKTNRYLFDTNTFYIVFLDEHHRFYKTG